MLAKPAAAVGRERRRVHRFEHKIMLLVDEIALAAGISAPKHVDQLLAMRAECLDGSIGERIPSELLVTVGLMGAHR